MADRRALYFRIFKKVLSRQGTKNTVKGNVEDFRILSAPEITTLMVIEHVTLFGREYVKTLVGNSNQDTALGYVSLPEFLRVTTGDYTWEYLED